MQKTNYYALMCEQLNSLEKKPKLLLHACCAPCASACLEILHEYFDVYVLFYNPNIEGEEYEKRLLEMKKFLDATGWATLVDCEHDVDEYYHKIVGLEGEKEGGKRCEKCFELRLEKTAKVARELGCDYVSTTLTISPLKNCALINQIGEKFAREKGVKWLFSDFKKKNGFLRSTELCKEYGLYRQNYCGCSFSKKTLEKNFNA